MSGVPSWILNLMSTDPYISLVSAIVNSFHLIVLCQKSMRTSSTNSIMIGIALSIVGWMTKSIYDLFKQKPSSTVCSPPLPYILIVVQWLSGNFVDLCTRCEALLGISLALVRVVAMKYPAGSGSGRFNNVSQTSFGWKVCLFVFTISLFLSASNLQRETVIEYKYPWTPSAKACQGLYPENYTQPRYIMSSSTSGIWGGYMSIGTLLMIDGVVSKIIPCIMFPILTILLALLLEKFAKNREKLFSGRNLLQRDSTTKLIICITVTFIISQLPLGILYILQSFCRDNDCFNNLNTIMWIPVVPQLLTTITHMPICFALSSQYRDTAKTLLRIRRKNEVNPEPTDGITRVNLDTELGRS